MNGSRILLWNQRQGTVWIAPPPKGDAKITAEAKQLLKTGVGIAVISQKSDELFYLLRGAEEIRRISLRNGSDRSTGMNLPGARFGFGVRADGKEVVYTDTHQKATFVVIDNLFK
jgi:hypothetical protein